MKIICEKNEDIPEFQGFYGIQMINYFVQEL